MIDVHAHYWPADYLDLLDRHGRDVETARALSARDAKAEIDARLRAMDDAGIERQVVSVTAQMPFARAADLACEAARLANDLTAEFVGAHPDRLAAFAVAPLPHLAESIAETTRALDALGHCGVAITTTVLERSLTDPEFEPFYAELDRRATVLFVHPAGSISGIAAGEPDLAWPVGSLFEETCALVYWLQHGYSSRFPNLRLIFTHLGGLLPLAWPRIKAAQPGPGDLPANVWLDSMCHGHGPALRAAVHSVGSSHIVLGTDYPFMQDDDLLRCVTFVRDLGDGDAERLILEDNAGRALRLLGKVA